MRRAAAALALAALAGCGAAARPAVDTGRLPPNGVPDVVHLTLGSGPGAVDVYRPRGAPGRLPAVLFLHGWGATDPVAYGRWIAHLVREGEEVIYPRYQRDTSSPPGDALHEVVLGVRAATAAAPIRSGSLVVAGHSAGGALAADYAASARPPLPRARAVFAVFPGRRAASIHGEIPAVRAPIPAGVRIVALAGARDTVVGSTWARRIARRGRYVLVTDPLAADHTAPQRVDVHARRAFWGPLDRLIAAVRRSPGA